MTKSPAVRKRVVRGVAAAAGLSALAMTASGCFVMSDGIYTFPLPGGPSLGPDPISVTAEFDQVPEVFPETMVKVNGVNVGKIDRVDLSDDGWNAVVSMTLQNDLQLPANSRISIQQTALLGEKFLAIEPPPQADRVPEVIEEGDVIPIDNSRVQIEIEDIFGALSLLLNGGGVAQIQPIIEELDRAFGGREPQVKALLNDTNQLVASLNNQRAEIQRAFDNVEVMSGRLDNQREQISRVVEEIPRGTQILSEQTPQIIEMLRQLDGMSQVGTQVIGQARDDLVQDLRALRPTLQALANSGPDLPNSIQLLPTYPFPDAAIDSTFGGAINGWLAVDLSIADTLENLGVGQGTPQYVAPYGSPQPTVDPSNPYIGGNGPRPGPGTQPLLPLGNLVQVGLPNGDEMPGPIQDLLNMLGDRQP
ncbi:MCE family protein [Hoyosella altamirensis]|uniref:Phospholipid/cholesterol/gamma-HCH transport system substrate-binding protein n=1 Tax=Hoyosella altamirensis TaxID=616997 RepID=A0A839RMQ9_9ACTN|nr:MCE family protein [Hoyosella altamirensis]MBB3037677.1 phospholipid/cholesterol/gamma-HCH transport system substrate-binding protein [Hoyosella altamirensis]